MCRTKAQSNSTTNRYIHKGNRYIESIRSTKPLSREGNTPDIRSYIRNKGPLKGQAYKLRNPSPLGG